LKLRLESKTKNISSRKDKDQEDKGVESDNRPKKKVKNPKHFQIGVLEIASNTMLYNGELENHSWLVFLS